MATTIKTTEAGRASASGYDAFVEDCGATSTFDLKAIADKAPSPAAAAQKAEESWKSITDGAQGMITTYFPQKESNSGEKITSSENATGDGVPELMEITASSSSEGSLTEKKVAGWAEKFSSSCEMNTVCGKFEFEFMKKDEAPASQETALTEQGELLQIEGPPPPKPWTEQVSDVTSETASSVSTKATGLMVALGLAAKKDQALLTDFYKTKPKPKEPEKPLSEKVRELQSGVTTKAQSLRASFMSTLRMTPEEKEMKQQLITDFDPNKPVPAPEEVNKSAPEEVVPHSLSVSTEPGSTEAGTVASLKDASAAMSAAQEEKQEEDGKKSSWNLWKQVKGFITKLSGKAAACEEVTRCPNVDCSSPEIPEIEISTPRIDIPSFTLLSTMSKTEETKKADEVKTEETKKVEETKADDTEAETSKAESPKGSNLPW